MTVGFISSSEASTVLGSFYKERKHSHPNGVRMFYRPILTDFALLHWPSCLIISDENPS
jgi:hypothetical protein